MVLGALTPKSCAEQLWKVLHVEAGGQCHYTFTNVFINSLLGYVAWGRRAGKQLICVDKLESINVHILLNDLDSPCRCLFLLGVKEIRICIPCRSPGTRLCHGIVRKQCMMNYNSHYEPYLISLIDLSKLQMGIRIGVKKADAEEDLSHTDQGK